MSLSELQARARFVQSSAANAGVHFDENRWLSRVRQSLERDAAEALGAAAKVFDVPRVLRATKPEDYLPQHFALGPYHCHRAELRDMERYKLAAAKRAEKLFADGKKFEHLAQQLLELGDKIRAPYHRYVARPSHIHVHPSSRWRWTTTKYNCILPCSGKFMACGH
jgi:hypothetical protein